MRQGSQDFETLAHPAAAARKTARGSAIFSYPFGRVGEGAVLDLAILAIGLTQQDGGAASRGLGRRLRT